MDQENWDSDEDYSELDGLSSIEEEENLNEDTKESDSEDMDDDLNDDEEDM
jgi:hypothetical protein